MKNNNLLAFAFYFHLKQMKNKKFKFGVYGKQLQIIFSAVDNSNLPHDKVKEIEASIQKQVFKNKYLSPDSTTIKRR